jgi:predicted aspartyl protease
MGTYTRCRIEHIAHRSRGANIPKLLVDTGREYTWVPEPVLEQLGIAREKKDLAFVMANGQTVTRSVGFAIVRIGERFTVDEVVFAEKGDLPVARRAQPRGSEPRGAQEARRVGTPARGVMPSVAPDSNGEQAQRRQLWQRQQQLLERWQQQGLWR